MVYERIHTENGFQWNSHCMVLSKICGLGISRVSGIMTSICWAERTLNRSMRWAAIRATKLVGTFQKKWLLIAKGLTYNALRLSKLWAIRQKIH